MHPQTTDGYFLIPPFYLAIQELPLKTPIMSGAFMSFITDIHIHSKYSRATSKQCDLENLYIWAQKKGIDVIGTGDFTHPAWRRELKEKLIPQDNGLFALCPTIASKYDSMVPGTCKQPVQFMLTVEISTIYKFGDKTRKVHHIICMPSLEAADRFAARLDEIGNINSDGRPILGLNSRNLLEIALECNEHAQLIPAHIWTPWFSAMGSKSGFDSIDECYQDLSHHITAIETGLSSDPEMNWRIPSLDRFRLISNSDAHSPQKIGREATCFSCEKTYYAIFQALKTGDGYAGTIEFYPEEGKYHMDGHRKCQICMDPVNTLKCNCICPSCKKPLTIGVMHRVETLAKRDIGTDIPNTAGHVDHLIPLTDILSEILNVGPSSKRVQSAYEHLLATLGPEMQLLTRLPIHDIASQTNDVLSQAIHRMRNKQVSRNAGYDGEFGIITVFSKDERMRFYDKYMFTS